MMNNSDKQFPIQTSLKLVLFGSAKISDKRKGIDYMIAACSILQNIYNEQIGLVAFGQDAEMLVKSIPFTVFPLNYLSNTIDIINLYSCVDLFVTPSLEENLPNTIMESMACGTPCVGFNIGGIPEMIDHKQNGYVAEYKNAQDLAAGIHWVLNEANYEELSKNAREKVVSHYNEEVIADRYIELYQNALEKHCS